MVGVINYGAGNIGSMLNIIKHVGGNPVLIESAKDFAKCSHLILPGVGAFDHGMKSLRNSGLLDELNYQVKDLKKPIMGVCLGAQLFTNNSEEGKEAGLGWLDAETIKFALDKETYRLPHMGWNYLTVKADHPLLEGLKDHSRFYFVHNYYLKPSTEKLVLTSSLYGHEFASGLCRDNIVGFQFHPEKSHKFGMKIISNFLKWRLYD